MNHLDMSAFWEVQTPNPIPIPEPINEDRTLRPPTERDTATTPKFGYMMNLSWQPFLGTTEKLAFKKEKAPRKKSAPQSVSPTRNDRPKLVHERRVKGGPKKGFLKKHNLNEKSHPFDWWTALMPLTPNDNIHSAKEANVKGNQTTKFAVSNWAAYTNAKASLVNAGDKGHIFEGKFKPLSSSDIFKMLGVYMLDGLSPTPRLEWTMQSQEKQPTHGNDRIANAIGPSYQQLYPSFRAFFAYQDPLMTPPPRAKCPNQEVHEFFNWLRYITKKAWVISETFYVDK